MVFEVIISTVSDEGEIICQAMAEFSDLPSPEQVQLVCELAMSNAKFAVATVHVSGNPSVLYGVIVESVNNGKEE